MDGPVSVVTERSPASVERLWILVVPWSHPQGMSKDYGSDTTELAILNNMYKVVPPQRAVKTGFWNMGGCPGHARLGIISLLLCKSIAFDFARPAIRLLRWDGPGMQTRADMRADGATGDRVSGKVYRKNWSCFWGKLEILCRSIGVVGDCAL